MDSKSTPVFDMILRNEVPPAPALAGNALFQRNQEQQTLLSLAIQNSVTLGADGAAAVRALLDAGAAASVFVAGYGPNSAVCTLPMAVQPLSSCFVHPPPLKGVSKEVLSLIDNKLAEYVDSRREEYERLRQEQEDAAAAAGSPPTPMDPVPAPSQPPFDHYPDTLKPGDIVRRGPCWSWGPQDEHNGESQAGIIRSVGTNSGGFGTSKTSYQIEWLTDATDASSGFNTNTYTYGKKLQRKLFLVDMSNPTAQPPEMAKIKKPAVMKLAKLKVGDKVRLIDNCTSSSLVGTKGVTLEHSQACLGTSSEGNVGVVVAVTQETYRSKTKSNPATATAKLPSGSIDTVVKVLSVHNGALCAYATSNLCFADGSSIIACSDLFAAPDITGVKPTTKGPKKPAGTFSPGDRVKLRSTANILNGCLGEPSYKWVGCVSSGGFGGRSSGSNTTVSVVCQEAKYGSYPMLSGNYPNWTYPASDLMHEHESDVDDEMPLSVGDRVELSDSFSANSCDGWCLGKKGEGKVGVVIFSPQNVSDGVEQRNIAVVAEDEPNRLFWFRASWLQRNESKIATKTFNVGDRVQLDVAQWASNKVETAGKCLGSPTDGCYGLVCGGGVIKEGIQRNIEVVAIGGSRHNDISLYPAYSLQPALWPCVLTDVCKSALSSRLQDVLSSQGMADSGVNVDELVSQYGINVWGRLLSIGNDPEGVIEEWEKWVDTRVANWPILEHGVRKKLPTSVTTDDHCSSDPYGIVGFTSTASGMRLKTWTCSKENGGKCNGFVNASKDSACRVCRTKIGKWKCAYCTAKNSVCEVACVACYSLRADSNKLQSENAEKRASKAINESKEATENETKRLAAVVEEVNELFPASPEEIVPSGRFLHVGSFKQCGGNPVGFVRCTGNGKCSSGFASCYSCGAGTHWTCCSSDEKSSRYCTEGLTIEAATKNAIMLYNKSDTRRRVQDFPGYVCPSLGSRLQWTCPLCSLLNDTGHRKCSVCLQGENPNPPDSTSNPCTASTGGGLADLAGKANSSEGILGSPKTGPVSLSGFSFGGSVSPGMTSDGHTQPSTVGAASSPPCKPFGAGVTVSAVTGPSTVSLLGGTATNGPPSGFSFGGSASPPGASGSPFGGSTKHSGPTGPRSGGFGRGSPNIRPQPSSLGRGRGRAAGRGFGRSGGAPVESSTNSKDVGPLIFTVSKPLSRLALALRRDKDAAEIDVKHVHGSVVTKKTKSVKGPPKGLCQQCEKAWIVEDCRPSYVCDDCGDSLENSPSIHCEDCSKWFCTNCINLTANTSGAGGRSTGLTVYDSDGASSDDDISVETHDTVTDGGIGNEDQLDTELERNALLSEKYFITGTENRPQSDNVMELDDGGSGSYEDNMDLHPPGLLDDLPEAPRLNRKTSTMFFKMSYYEAVGDINGLCFNTDKNGNSPAHHAAYMGLHKTVESLIRAGVSRWAVNAYHDTIALLEAGFPSGSGHLKNKLFKAISKRNLLNSFELQQLAMSTPFNCATPPNLAFAVKAIYDGDNEHDAAFFLQEADDKQDCHFKLYRALFNVQYSYGPIQAEKDLSEYLLDVVKASRIQNTFIDPMYYYVRFRLFKGLNGHLASYAKKERLLAYDALTAFRMYPEIAEKWLSPEETYDVEVEEAGIDSDVFFPDRAEDDYSELFPPLGANDPETLWENAKREFGLVSPSMDSLMTLTGLKAVKHKAKDVCLTVLLDPPKDLQTGTSCNFTFIGNPGCGKTTVATLLAQSMAELKYRTNDKPVLISADEILGAQQPVAAFSQMVQDAEGGTLFIDEAYLFDPAPKGKTQNDSNKVLNILMKASEQKKLTTTFILAGYKEEMQILMSSNPGFPSRFPKTFTFDFVDYNEAELTKILSDMATKRKYRFQTQKECGVPIARVLARRIYRGANKKGFGNGRECEKVLDSCIQNQLGRLVRLKERRISISDADYRTLTRADTVGERPQLEDSVHMRELNSMIGLIMVKESMRNLMNLQLQNFDAEMRGEKIQLISLHRVFYGNPGTGKTTVAKLYGKMLKEFGFLSDGDIIITTPADLKGSAVGEGVARTKSLLDAAKGKVLFIDEAYNLDPARGTGTFGAEVLDVILEKIEANAGSDMAVVMAGYRPQMEQLFRNVKNPGLKRRFNLGEAFLFEDFSDEDIRRVLKRQIVQAELYTEASTLDYAVSLISQKRMEDGFGNAGEAEQILGRAKLRHSARLSAAEVPPSNLKLLLRDDFEGEITSIEKARAAFADLENIDHVMSVLDNFEAMCAVADEEGKARQELISDCHMLFLGPPGSGKTTMGKRFAIMFKQLNLLPSDRFEYTTASNLIDRFVGGTGNNTLEAMRRAKGGVLMIDEAYAMLPARNNFGGDIMQALLDNVTTEEFKGKIIIILSGYKEHVEDIFSINPGFQSRFDKKRIEFPEWGGKVAADAVVHVIERDGKSVDLDARDAMVGYFDALRNLPNWASARDAMEWIKPSLDAARADRQFKHNQDRRLLASTVERKQVPSKSKASRANQAPPLSYSIDDVKKVFIEAISARGGSIDPSSGLAIVEATGKTKALNSKMAFKEAVNYSKRANKLLVICYTNPKVCKPCEKFKPLYENIAAENREIVFATVDAEKGVDVFKMNNVFSIPHTFVYLNGTKIDEVQGCDPDALVNVIRAHNTKKKKMDANLPPPIKKWKPDRAPAIPPISAPVRAQVAQAVAVRIKDADPDDGSDGEKDDSSDEDAWTALEEACAELGYTLDRLRDMLADADNFPPNDLMNIVLRKVNSKNPGKVKNMLSQQRPSVLAKVNTAIEEDKKAKSAAEAKQQERVQAIGKCPMGFTWHKEGGGWRCGGGSHFVSDMDIQNYMESAVE